MDSIVELYSDKFPYPGKLLIVKPQITDLKTGFIYYIPGGHKFKVGSTDLYITGLPTVFLSSPSGFRPQDCVSLSAEQPLFREVRITINRKRIRIFVCIDAITSASEDRSRDLVKQ